MSIWGEHDVKEAREVDNNTPRRPAKAVTEKHIDLVKKIVIKIVSNSLREIRLELSMSQISSPHFSWSFVHQTLVPKQLKMGHRKRVAEDMLHHHKLWYQNRNITSLIVFFWYSGDCLLGISSGRSNIE